jgi:amino acid transporter
MFPRSEITMVTSTSSGDVPRRADAAVTAAAAASGSSARLQRALTTPKIVFLVIAAAAPLTAMVGTVPLAFALGDGAGFPAVFVFAGLTLLCFSVGYAAMSRRIVNAGGFYTYLGCGLGKPVAVAGGAIAVISYPAVTIGMVGAFGYFTHIVVAAHGVDVPWEVCAGAAVLVMGVLGYRQIDLSAKVLSILLMAEISILTAFDAGVLGHHGGSSFPLTSFGPHTVFAAGVGVSMMFAFMSYIGFESAAMYGEESRNPERSVPLATYGSVLLITAFYALTSWAAVGAVGPGQVRGVATRQLGNLFFMLSDKNLDSVATTIMQAFMCTSLFAGVLALHNAGNRYIFALGRERVLPGLLGAVHRRHQSPHRASLVQTAVTVVIVAAFAAAGLDPYVNLATSMLGIGTVGIIVLQAAAAASVVPFFWRRSDRHWWRTGLAPLLGFAGLITALVLLVRNFTVVTGTTNPAVTALPWILFGAAGAGFCYALWMRWARPGRYAGLAAARIREAADTADRPQPPETASATATPDAVGEPT